MIDLKKSVLPSSVEVDGLTFSIQTSFHYGIIFHSLLTDTSAVYGDFDIFFPYEKPINKKNAFEALYDFYCEKHPLPRNMDGDSSDIICDYDLDADLIYSAFYEQYNINLLTAELHWFEFRALFGALHNTKLNEVMEARSFNPGDKTSYESMMRKRKNMWRIEPKQTTEETDEDLKKFNELFG